MNKLINSIKFFFLFIHSFYIKIAGKRDSSKSRYVCAVDEILKTDHLKPKIQIVLDSRLRHRCKEHVVKIS